MLDGSMAVVGNEASCLFFLLAGSQASLPAASTAPGAAWLAAVAESGRLPLCPVSCLALSDTVSAEELAALPVAPADCDAASEAGLATALCTVEVLLIASSIELLAPDIGDVVWL